MSSGYEYRVGQELVSVAVDWRDKDNATVDFSTGWTFTVYVAAATAPSTALVTKTTGITGAATAPNVTIDWTTTELAALTAGTSGTIYVAHLVARRTADSKDRWFRPGNPITFKLWPAVG